MVFRAVFRLPLSLSSSMIQPESSSELSFRSPLDCDRLLRHSPQNARTCYSKAVPFLPPILDSNKSSLIIPLRGGTNFLFPSFINWIYLCSWLTECNVLGHWSQKDGCLCFPFSQCAFLGPFLWDSLFHVPRKLRNLYGEAHVEKHWGFWFSEGVTWWVRITQVTAVIPCSQAKSSFELCWLQVWVI